MAWSRNDALAAWMTEHEIAAPHLAELVNEAMSRVSGCRGNVGERTVFRWLSGESRWPQERIRRGLEDVTGLPATHLGFVPRVGTAKAPTARQEDPLHRRTFITAATGTTLALTPIPTAAASGRLGHSDVERLYTHFAEIVATDHRQGGIRSTEEHAVDLAEHALRLQQNTTASQAVRNAFYGCAAAFTSSAMWAATDGKRYTAAQAHLQRAASLAAMSGDQHIQFRIWSHAGSLYRHMGRPADALAANDVARNLAITRRDPMFASLGHARHAAILGLTDNPTATDRCLGYARDALDRANPTTRRPVWIKAFYGPAEIDSLATAAHLALGRYELAEAGAHRSLAHLQPHLRRTRAILSSRLARAQLGQGDLEPAVASAMSIPAADAAHPRVVAMLAAFTTTLNTTAPRSGVARTWRTYLNDHRKATTA
ncbi:XRE family transcriptional regulator [Streptomyces sp. NPDC017993]|uniref:XRE family transcriptional regulator n=1 Tax=Streptomyces sp. NPDC017993 TaxID=3365027 RepID=UPI00378BAD9A